MRLLLVVASILPTVIMAQGAGDLCTVPVRARACFFHLHLKIGLLIST